MANVDTVISLISGLAPRKLAFDWDNVGLQVGDYSQSVARVLLALDINQRVLEEALERSCEMIVSHHPLIFDSLDSVHTRTETGRVIYRAIQKQIAIYSAHTNLDQVRGGLNDYLADLLEVEQATILETTGEAPYYKLVVFIPETALSRVKQAIMKQGAGHIGNYSDTSFRVKGTGSFRPREGSQPYRGQVNKLTEVKEYRLETIIPADQRSRVIKALLEAHPYEEVAYDLYPLENEGEKSGIGRIGVLKESCTLQEYISQVKQALGLTQLKVVARGNPRLRKIALCSGSGADFIRRANTAGADLYLTGDVKYHEAQLAEELGLSLIDAGHYGTEQVVRDLLYDYLNDQDPDIEFLKSKVNTNPWQRV